MEDQMGINNKKAGKKGSKGTGKGNLTKMGGKKSPMGSYS